MIRILDMHVELIRSMVDDSGYVFRLTLTLDLGDGVPYRLPPQTLPVVPSTMVVSCAVSDTAPRRVAHELLNRVIAHSSANEYLSRCEEVYKLRGVLGNELGGARGTGVLSR